MITQSEKRTIYSAAAFMTIVDTNLQDRELAFLRRLAIRLGLSEEERREIQGAVNMDFDVKAALAGLSAEGRQLFRENFQGAAQADGKIHPRERAILDRMEELLSEL